MIALSRFDDAEQFIRRYMLQHGELPTKGQVAQYLNICTDTMTKYARAFAAIGVHLPNTRPRRDISVGDLKAFVDEFQAANGRLPYVDEFTKRFAFRYPQVAQRFLALLEVAHGIALPEFAPQALPPPQPDPEDAEDEKPARKATSNEREPRPAEACPLGLRLVVYQRRARVLKFYRADCSDTSEPASFVEAVKRLKELDAAGVHTSIA